MDVDPYLTKMDLKIYNTYHDNDLSFALEKLFGYFITMGMDFYPLDWYV